MKKRKGHIEWFVIYIYIIQYTNLIYQEISNSNETIVHHCALTYLPHVSRVRDNRCFQCALGGGAAPLFSPPPNPPLPFFVFKFELAHCSINLWLFMYIAFIPK